MVSEEQVELDSVPVVLYRHTTWSWWRCYATNCRWQRGHGEGNLGGTVTMQRGQCVIGVGFLQRRFGGGVLQRDLGVGAMQRDLGHSWMQRDLG